MKKIINIIPFIDSDGNRSIQVVYTNGKKILPFSEAALLKLRKEYERQRNTDKNIISNVRSKINIPNIDINIDKFASYVIDNKDMIVRRIEIVITAIGLAWLIKYMHQGFENIPDHVLPEETKEEVITYNVSEYYNNLYEESIKSK